MFPGSCHCQGREWGLASQNKPFSPIAYLMPNSCGFIQKTAAKALGLHLGNAIKHTVNTLWFCSPKSLFNRRFWNLVLSMFRKAAK
jgi:hypothetical protein